MFPLLVISFFVSNSQIYLFQPQATVWKLALCFWLPSGTTAWPSHRDFSQEFSRCASRGSSPNPLVSPNVPVLPSLSPRSSIRTTQILLPWSLVPPARPSPAVPQSQSSLVSLRTLFCWVVLQLHALPIHQAGSYLPVHLQHTTFLSTHLMTLVLAITAQAHSHSFSGRWCPLTSWDSLQIFEATAAHLLSCLLVLAVCSSASVDTQTLHTLPVPLNCHFFHKLPILNDSFLGWNSNVICLLPSLIIVLCHRHFSINSIFLPAECKLPQTQSLLICMPHLS